MGLTEATNGGTCNQISSCHERSLLPPDSASIEGPGPGTLPRHQFSPGSRSLSLSLSGNGGGGQACLAQSICSSVWHVHFSYLISFSILSCFGSSIIARTTAFWGRDLSRNLGKRSLSAFWGRDLSFHDYTINSTVARDWAIFIDRVGAVQSHRHA